MTARPALRLLSHVLVLGGASGVVALGATLIHEVGGLRGGPMLVAWSLGFAVLLPVTLAALAILAPRAGWRPTRRIVPNAGWKVPGAGQ